MNNLVIRLIIYIHLLHPATDTIPSFSQPIKRADFKYITSPFGVRIDPITKQKHWHNGIDIGVKHPQTIVYCTADGIVEALGYHSSKGAYITIQHDDDFQTKYFHLDNIFIRRGEEVKQGQKIGIVGNTGKSTAIHLHYEIHFNGDAIDPLLFNN